MIAITTANRRLTLPDHTKLGANGIGNCNGTVKGNLTWVYTIDAPFQSATNDKGPIVIEWVPDETPLTIG